MHVVCVALIEIADHMTFSFFDLPQQQKTLILLFGGFPLADPTKRSKLLIFGNYILCSGTNVHIVCCTLIEIADQFMVSLTFVI